MNKVDELIEKYFEGDTSLQEEKLIRKYFENGDIRPKHQAYAPMFGFFTQERKTVSIPVRKKKKLPLFAWASIAASIVLVLSVRIFFWPEQGTNVSVVYVNGVKISDSQTINAQALNSIQSVSHIDEETVNSQIGILDSFTE
jgi:hypothetical protein